MKVRSMPSSTSLAMLRDARDISLSRLGIIRATPVGGFNRVNGRLTNRKQTALGIIFLVIFALAILTSSAPFLWTP